MFPNQQHEFKAAVRFTDGRKAMFLVSNADDHTEARLTIKQMMPRASTIIVTQVERKAA